MQTVAAAGAAGVGSGGWRAGAVGPAALLPEGLASGCSGKP
jgi:hypothetical protein